MLFILTNAEDATASFLVDRLSKNQVPFLRLDTDTLISKTEVSYRAQKPALKVDGTLYRPEDVDHIWYRRPEKLKTSIGKTSPEVEYTIQEWSEALEGFFAHIPKKDWVNYPAYNAAASHKLEQLTTASRLGFKIPDTLVTQDPNALRDFFDRNRGRVIVKPMASGYVERSLESYDSLIYTNPVTEQHLDNLADLPACPTMFQQYIRKQFDVRITVIDAHIHPVALADYEEDGTARCDIRRNNMKDVVYQRIELPSLIIAKIRHLVSHYKLRFAAIDMAVDLNGEWHFFEINPNGQWAWLEICADVKISDSFLDSFKRV